MVFAQNSAISFQPIMLEGFRSVLSLFNSIFILMALPWFRYLPSSIEPVIKSRYWIYIVGLPFLFSLLPTMGKIMTGNSEVLISELDVYYSILTLIFLGMVLWESFTKRKLYSLALLSMVSIGLTLAAQFFKMYGSNVNMMLFSAIFKTTLIMIFFALALSWVKELSENIIPLAKHLYLTLYKLRNQDKYEYIAEIDGLLDREKRRARLSLVSFELLQKFARATMSKNDAWLEIKPKSETRAKKAYDINDHNEIKRLLSGLLDGIFGKNRWTRNQHESVFRNVFFEMSPRRERKIRLKVPPENITLT